MHLNESFEYTERAGLTKGFGTDLPGTVMAPLSIIDWHVKNCAEENVQAGAMMQRADGTYAAPFSSQAEIAALHKEMRSIADALRAELYSQVDTLRREIAHARDYSAGAHDKLPGITNRLATLEQKLHRLGSALRGDDAKAQSAGSGGLVIHSAGSDGPLQHSGWVVRTEMKP